MSSVFITGAATGIGRATARMLDAEGWQVFAGALPDQDTAALSEGTRRLTVVPIDITDDASVSAAADAVRSEVDGLEALVNNAGIAHLGNGPVAGVVMDEARAVFEVNVFGTLRVTQAFLPLLHAGSDARIVNLSSGATRVPVPIAGPYTMSKLAVEGLTKTLRLELAPFGIQATSIQPGGVRTPMTDGARDGIDATWSRMSDPVRQRYEPVLRPANERLVAELDDANEPEVIASVIVGVLGKRNLAPSYVAGKEMRMLPLVQGLMSERMFERVLLGRFGLAAGSAA